MSPPVAVLYTLHGHVQWHESLQFCSYTVGKYLILTTKLWSFKNYFTTVYWTFIYILIHCNFSSSYWSSYHLSYILLKCFGIKVYWNIVSITSNLFCLFLTWRKLIYDPFHTIEPVSFLGGKYWRDLSLLCSFVYKVCTSLQAKLYFILS